MKKDKKITQFTKRLVELSKEEGVVTESKVNEVLDGLKKVQPRHLLILLKTYLYYIKREVAAQTAVVATAGGLSAESLHTIEANFSKIYNRSIKAETVNDDSLIAGVRVRIADDVYDASIVGHLNRLAEAVH